MKLVIVGAGGHGKVVLATAQAAGFEVVGIFDDDPAKVGQALLGVPVRGTVDEAAGAGCPVVVAVGENRSRQAVCERLGGPFGTVVHPAAEVHSSVEVGAGTVIFAGAVVQPATRLGRHVILNTAATVDHDGELGDWVHCGPGSHLAGNVSVGDGALLGVGCSVVPDVRIGSWVTVGAGAAVVEDVPDGVCIGGVPARRLARDNGRRSLRAPRSKTS